MNLQALAAVGAMIPDSPAMAVAAVLGVVAIGGGLFMLAVVAGDL